MLREKTSRTLSISDQQSAEVSCLGACCGLW
jgi:hypothetical protein